mmetsp:Transcript_16934/g.28921  ORF Transcript_16934/g.28921 Transcript_16934/m.28921 type:complete len:135 (-) Transcript_16934:38-442(-)
MAMFPTKSSARWWAPGVPLQVPRHRQTPPCAAAAHWMWIRTRSPKVLQPVNPHRDVLRRRLAHGDAVSEVGAMLEKRIAESHASLERKFEHLAKQLLQPGATALPGVSPQRCNVCCAGSASRQASSRKRESQLS